ncbi:MAG: RnfH family protein [Dokdonella sp.]|nr:RnfH family protein [Dokdonella sp.]
MLVEIDVAQGTTAAEAIELSGIPLRFPLGDPESRTIGIFGKVAGPNTALRHGDRVEIYRPLTVDPKTARHHRASRRD